MRKYHPGKQEVDTTNPSLSAIAYILAFLIGVLLFLLFGESTLGVKPNPTWIALLMGLSVSAVVFWVWREIYNKDDKHDN